MKDQDFGFLFLSFFLSFFPKQIYNQLQSSNINEVIRTILNFFFLRKDFGRTKSTKETKATKRTQGTEGTKGTKSNKKQQKALKA